MAQEHTPGPAYTPPPATLEERRQQRHESRTGSTYHAFLDDLCELGGLDAATAECAAVSVLCAFEQRVYGSEAKHLEAQLPLKLRELLVRCSLHEGKPAHKYGKQELFQKVADELNKDVTEVEPIVRAVIATVRAQVSEGEAEQFGNMLPKDLKELWYQPS
jgi:uncharacterized protein (DUF2267 family)